MGSPAFLKSVQLNSPPPPTCSTDHPTRNLNAGFWNTTRPAVCVWLRTWASDLARRRSRLSADQPVLIVGEERGKRIVRSACAFSLSCGVCSGMTVAHATALLPTAPRLADERPADDATTLRALARWATRFSPSVTPDLPDALLIDATGCTRLYGNLGRMVRQIDEAVRKLGFAARVACGPNSAAAWAIARFTDKPAVSVDDLHELPTAALRIEPGVIDALAEVGVDTVGQLAAIERKEVAARFGPQPLHRLDLLFGRAAEVAEPEKPLSVVSVHRRFEGPTTAYEAIEHTARNLCHDLAHELHRAEAGTRKLVLDVERLDDRLKPQRASETIRLSRPSREGKHLWTLLRPTIERLHLGNGVEALRLRAGRIERIGHGQVDLDGQSETDSDDLGELIDLLQSRLGRENVLIRSPVATWVPEAVWSYRPADEPASTHEPTGSPPAWRPTMLLKPTTAVVSVMQPEGPVISLRWNGQTRKVVSCIGPERIGRRWWLGPPVLHEPAVRDYYRLQDETGLWLWVFRHRGNDSWFVHGVWS